MLSSYVVEEIHDVDVPWRLWSAAGPPPLLLVAPGDEARALAPLQAPSPIPCRPSAGDRWIDYRSGYGAFSILAKRSGVDLIVPIEPEPAVADLAGRAMYLEGLPAPTALDVDSTTLLGMVVSFNVNAVRLEGAPRLDLEKLPAVGKVIIRVAGIGRQRMMQAALERLYSQVSVQPAGYGECLLYAWGRRGER